MKKDQRILKHITQAVRLISSRHALLALMLTTLTGCASLSQDWQLQKQDESIDYFEREGAVSSLPEFKAAITIQAPLSEVMMLMTDFSRHPEWVYGCKHSSVISLAGYTEAYLYQVTALPVIRDRDMLTHAITQNDGKGRMRIRMESVPAYCDDNDAEACAAIRESSYVRVSEAQGEFVLTEVDKNTTQIEWTQFVDPAGWLPHWVYRVALPQVPMKSLEKLKAIVEAPGR